MCVQKMKANIFRFGGAAAFCVAVAGTIKSVNEIDQFIVSHEELAAEIDPIKAQIASIQKWNMCDRLERRITESTLQLQVAKSGTEYFSEVLERDKSRFSANNCSQVL